jgi:hypothetical protein
MGRLGRKCAFIVCDRNIKLPSDLSGVTIANFNSDACRIEDSLEDAVNKVKLSVSNSKGYKEVDFLRSYFAFFEPGKVKLEDKLKG